MCRLGFISLDKAKDVTNITQISMIEYEGNNTHGAGISLTENKGFIKNSFNLRTVKSFNRAALFWLNSINKIGKLFTKDLIWHVRYATHGKHTNENSHPFVNENNTISLVHNGSIYSHEKAKQGLESMGHKFTSETDSEVLLHAYEEWGTEMFEQLSASGIDHIGAFVILDNRNKNPKLVAYTDNNRLMMYENEFGLFGYSQEDLDFLGNKIPFENYKMYEIENGHYMVIKEVEQPKPAYATIYGGYKGYQKNLGEYENAFYNYGQNYGRKARNKRAIREMKEAGAWDRNWSKNEKRQAIREWQESDEETEYHEWEDM